MKLFTGILTRQGGLSVTEGIPLKKTASGKVVMEIGRPNRDGNFARIRVGDRFAKTLEEDAACSRDGKVFQDKDNVVIPGRCPECGIELKPGDEKKVWTELEGGIKVWDYFAAHTFVTRFRSPKSASFHPVDVHGERKLLLVEEKPNDKDGRIGLLLYAEPVYQGRTAVVAPSQPELFGRAVGQRWLSRNSRMGFGVERLMLLKPNDKIIVRHSPGSVVYTVHVGVDFSLQALKVELPHPTVKESAPVKETATPPAEAKENTPTVPTTDC